MVVSRSSPEEWHPPGALPERIGTASPTPMEFLARAGPHLPLSLTTVQHTVHDWVKHRLDPAIGLVPGSIDTWAAVDFAGALQRSAGSAAARLWDLDRDTPIYADPDLRISLLCNRRSLPPMYPMLAIGLRMQSLMVSPARFRQGVEAELLRLERQPSRPEFAEARRHLMVVTLDAPGRSALQGLSLTLHTDGKDGVAVWWREIER